MTQNTRRGELDQAGGVIFYAVGFILACGVGFLILAAAFSRIYFGE